VSTIPIVHSDTDTASVGGGCWEQDAIGVGSLTGYNIAGVEII
jgi:hypothetical protein